MISDGDFEWLVFEFGGFCADYFALDSSYRMRPFFLRYISEKSSGSDAFSQDWSSGFGYFHPPVALAPSVLDKAKEDRAQGILLLPDWPGSMLAMEVRQLRQLKLVGSFRPVFECPSWFENSTFRGVSKFDILVYRMMF